MSVKSDTVRETAARAGLSQLNKDHLAQLQRAIESAQELAGKLPKDLHYSEEIVLTFSLPAPEGNK
jgi:hypothetical protein